MATSVVVHGLAFAAILLVARTAVRQAVEEDEHVVSAFYRPSPPPPPPSPAAAPKPETARVERPRTRPMVVPTVTPPDVPEPEPSEPDVPSEGVEEVEVGVEGGVIGGVVGGTLGGEVGGVLGSSGDGDPLEPRPLTPDMSPPEKIFEVLPDYPLRARQAKRAGEVILECIIRADGSVEVHRVLREIPLLTEAAIECVKKWKYRPALHEGRAITVYLTVRVRFDLA
jgi:protein TonB